MSEISIEIKDVRKEYRLGAIGGGTLKGDIQSWWARKHGKEDPNLKIGEKGVKNARFLALNGINLTVHKGEALGIIGHNGAGKSTLLKLLSRVTAPTEGTIKYNGRIASMLEVGTGFHPELTGRENIYMNGAILGMTREEIDSKIEEIIDFSEVREFIDTPVKRYSSGMYVKLAFSVAAHLDSEIMIMDEVLAVGDMSFQKKCLDKMKRAAKEDQRTVLYVSHNMNTITQLCDRCVVLEKGKIIFDGDVDKAIGLYLSDSSTDADTTDIDLSNKRMEHLSKEIVAKVTRLILKGKEKVVYEFGEHIPFDLCVHSNKSLNDLSLRVEIRTSNSSVGITMINGFGSISENEDKMFSFDMCLDGLVTGEYFVCLVLYEINDYGSFLDLDAIYPAFRFEIIDTFGNMKINWSHSQWGNILFSDLKQLESK